MRTSIVIPEGIFQCLGPKVDTTDDSDAVSTQVENYIN